MKKLFNWIWAKPKKEPQTWMIAHDGWEASAKTYNQAHNIHNGLI
ncbi:hypothetical protein ABZ559_04940 [Streptococcus sp. ZY19097]